LRFASIIRYALDRRWPGRREVGDATPRDIDYEEFRALPATKLRAELAGDPCEAARWIRAGAFHGFPEAQLMLGQMLLDGTGLDRDHAAAMRWFLRAAAAGLAEAMNMVGRCHELGWGVPADPATAATWYRRAAERGLDWGQFNLANLMLYGIAVPRDRPAALAWYRRAAARGHAKSMNLVGRFLEEGWDGAPDPVQALSWYRGAAERGDFRGQYNLATLLLGQGHADEAERWFRAAIDGGSPDFLRSAGASLSGRREPALRTLGHIARSRYESAAQSAAA
jgi:TPR repeat protein